MLARSNPFGYNDHPVNIELKKNLPFILLTLLLFLVESRPLVTQGMFFDGMFYSSIAWNMANHIGSLWAPKFNALFFPEFYEHPPLGIFLQSLFFRLTHSDSIYVDKFYCFVVALVNIFLVYILWKKTTATKNKYVFWIPILIWLLLLDDFLHIQMGFLEPAMTIFTTLSALCLIQAMQKKKSFFTVCAGFFIVIAFLINGLQAFFPIFIPFIYWLVFRRNLIEAGKQTAILLLVIVFLFSLLYGYAPARQNLQHYFTVQLLPSFFGHRVGAFVGWKHILGLMTLLHNCIYLIALALFLYFLNAKKNHSISHWAIFFGWIALTAALPVLLSTRQTGHYFYQAFPFLVLLFAHWVTPFFEDKIVRLNINNLAFKFTLGVLLSGIMIAGLWLGLSAGKISRDQALLTDVLKIQKQVPTGSVVSLSADLSTDWKLLIYLYRYQKIAATPQPGHTYLLNSKKADQIPPGYQWEDNLQLYDLYMKI